MAASGCGLEAIRLANGLAYVCRHLDELRELLGDDGSDPSTALMRLVAVLQGGASGQAAKAPELAGVLEEVHAQVQAAGDVLGVYGSGSSRGGGLSGMEVLQFVYRCPLGRCAGRLAHEVAQAQPVCTVSEARQSLIRERL